MFAVFYVGLWSGMLKIFLFIGPIPCFIIFKFGSIRGLGIVQLKYLHPKVLRAVHDRLCCAVEKCYALLENKINYSL
jgi:hypothetical protein